MKLSNRNIHFLIIITMIYCLGIFAFSIPKDVPEYLRHIGFVSLVLSWILSAIMVIILKKKREENKNVVIYWIIAILNFIYFLFPLIIIILTIIKRSN